MNSQVKLTAGEHVISIEKSGFNLWKRTMTVSAGGNVTVEASLEKQGAGTQVAPVAALTAAALSATPKKICAENGRRIPCPEDKAIK